MVKNFSILGLFVVVLVVGCSGPAGPECGSDDDCGAGERCLSSGGLFFGSAYCVTTGEEVPANNVGTDMGMQNNGPDCDPGFEENACDLTDGDGDGVIDEGCPCEFDGLTEGVCGMATRDCLGECVAPMGYEAEEMTCDGIDNDCDGEIDEGIAFVATKVTAGDSHSCALDAGGVPYCWGRNNQGQLGTESMNDTAVPTEVEVPITFDDISAGATHTCAVSRQSGAIYCWGSNGSSESGPANTEVRVSPTRIDPPTGSSWSAVTAGTEFTCGLADGTVYCWGANDIGQTGNVPTMDPVSEPTPIDVDSSLVFDQIDAGDEHACGRTTAGDGYCWGSSANERLARSVSEPYGPPGVIPDNDNLGLEIEQITAGFNHSCAEATIGVSPLDVSGVTCRGANDFGQRGGTPPPNVVETDAIGPTAAGSYFSCSYDANDAIDCWGRNDFGQAGREAESSVAVGRVQGIRISDSNRVLDLAAGARHACAVLTDGVYCWGDNEFGQLGTDVAQPGTTAVRCLP